MAADCEPSLDHHIDMDDVQLNSDNSVLNENSKEDSGNDVLSEEGKEHNHNGVPNGEGKEDDGCYKRYSDLTNEDIRGMEFETEETAYEFYEMYAKDLGFAIRKDELKRDCHNNVVMRQLVCNKEGKRNKKHKLNEDESTYNKLHTRGGCKAKIRFVFDFGANIWTVTAFEPLHNHDLVPSGFVHLIPKYRELSQADKEIASGLRSQGVRTCHILGYMMGQKGGHRGLGFTKKDLYNFTQHQGRGKVQDGDTYATLSYLQLKADNEDMFFRFTLSDDDQIENLFWADSTSRLDYDCFGDVVAFDSTYKKNRYNKPLVIFCGYNHHGETTIFACALISNETAETYKWVLNMFSKAMSKHPHAVITDGDKAMREAIRVVFPNTLHRLCSWHIHQKACENVKIPAFLSDFKSLMYSYHTPEKFEAEWKRVINLYRISDNTWIKNVYQSRTMWASSYMQDKFFCGFRTTSMCEGVNSFIKMYVQQKNSLVDFLHNFERVVKEYRHNELVSDFKSLYYYERTLTTALQGIELGASRIFTNKNFIEVKKAIEDAAALKVIEWNMVGNTVMLRTSRYCNNDYEVLVSLDKVENKFLCDCRRYERKGLPCCHIICLMKYEDMDKFPDSLICKRWTKTAKKDCITSIGSQEGKNEKMVMFRRSALMQAFNALCEVCCEGATDYKQALEGIYSLRDEISKRRVDANDKDKPNGSAPDIRDPLVVKTKGAPRKNKFIKKKRCSHCRRTGHTIRKCPALDGRGVVHEDVEEVLYSKSDDESKNLDESISHDKTDEVSFQSPCVNPTFGYGADYRGTSMFPQFPPVGFPPSHSSTSHYSGIERPSVTSEKSFTTVLEEMERLAKIAKGKR